MSDMTSPASPKRVVGNRVLLPSYQAEDAKKEKLLKVVVDDPLEHPLAKR
jgi:hypothetical protein